MRVAMVTPRFPPRVGGVEHHVAQLTVQLASQGVEVDILTVEHSGSPSLGDGRRIRSFANRSPSDHYAFAPGIFRFLRKHGEGYDIVHAHSFHALSAFLAAVSATTTNFVFTPHYHDRGHTRAARVAHRLYDRPAERIFARSAAVVCCSNCEAAVISKTYPSTAGRLSVIYNGVDDGALTQLPTEKEDGIVLVSGRLEKYKNVEAVLRSFALVRSGGSVLVVSGEGRDRDRLLGIARKEGLVDRVRFVGNVPSAELRDWQRRARVVVALSTHEAFGLSLLEGAVAGANVVASDIPAHREVSDLVPGRVRLVDVSASPAEVAQAITEALGRGRPRGQLDRVPTWQELGRSYLRLYEQVLAGA
jgi:glycosyltransferase involved in cell wall biosynthesis